MWLQSFDICHCFKKKQHWAQWIWLTNGVCECSANPSIVMARLGALWRAFGWSPLFTFHLHWPPRLVICKAKLNELESGWQSVRSPPQQFLRPACLTSIDSPGWDKTMVTLIRTWSLSVFFFSTFFILFSVGLAVCGLLFKSSCFIQSNNNTSSWKTVMRTANSYNIPMLSWSRMYKSYWRFRYCSWEGSAG